MTNSDKKLIEQLRLRNADRSTATDGGMHPKKPYACVNEAKLDRAEQSLGFKLPELLRGLYLEVGNGGFGPEYGIVGLSGGARLDDCTLVTNYKELLDIEKESPAWKWPEQLLPLANYGCGMWACTDCTYKRLPMFLWDPNNLLESPALVEMQKCWAYSFWDLGVSLKRWLSNWANQVEQPEPKMPSHTWTKKRLGFTRHH